MSIYNKKLDYYVYAYLREDGTPYYIGKGLGNRAFVNHKRIELPRDKKRIVFLEKKLTEVGALALERRYILWYGRKSVENGILYNLTNGGDGGGDKSLAHREKIRKSMLGKNTGARKREICQKISMSKMGKKRKPFTEEHRKKISESNKRRIVSSETREKMRTSQIGNKNSVGKKVSVETREKLRQFNLGKKLSPTHKINLSLSRIGKKRGKYKTKKLYVWVFLFHFYLQSTCFGYSINQFT